MAKRESIWRGPIVDVHMHPMLDSEPIIGTRPHSSEDYLRLAKGLDIRHVGSLVIARAGEMGRTLQRNDLLIQLSHETKGRFFPACSVHPSDGPGALEEIDRVAAQGARMLKLHPNTQNFDVADPSVAGVVQRATERHLPVLFDAYSPFDANQPGKFVRLAMEVPESRLILAHAHGPRFADLLVYEFLARYPWWKRNVWIDLSATAPLVAGGPMAETFTWVVRKFGVDRALFGSDYPLDDPVPAVRALLQLGFTRKELDRIFYANACQLLGLE